MSTVTDDLRKAERALAEAVFDATVRIDRIVHAPVMFAADPIDSDVRDWLEDGALEPLCEAVGWPKEKAEQMAWEELAEELPFVTGWFIDASHPVMTKSGTGARFSWGHYRTRTFHGVTYEEALQRVLDWANAEYAAVMSGGETRTGSGE